MPVEVRHNIVRFRYGAAFSAAVALTLQGDWTISAGLQPNINAAVIDADDYAALGMALYPAGRTGSIEFWFSQAPTEGEQPDVTLGGITLVEDEIRLIGRRPGELTNRTQVVAVRFADHRDGFAEPRGGRLNQGVLNPTPRPTGYTLRPNSQLIGLCLAAMGVPTAVPSSVDAVEPMRDIAWLGDHAPSELSRLLEHTGHVYCVASSGQGFVSQPGAGAIPSIPASRLSYNIQRGNVDRRPLDCVITSAPTAVTRTFTGAGALVPAWEYVVQDHADNMRWKPIAQVAALSAGAPSIIAAFRSELKNVPDAWREHYKSQLYRAVRVDTTRFDARSCPILSRVYMPDGTSTDLNLTATIATQETGGWVNRSRAVKARQIVPEAGVVIFEDYLGTVDVGGTGAAALLNKYFTELAPAAIKPTFSIEAWDEVSEEKLFAVFGYATGGGVVTPLIEADARTRLKGYWPTTGIYQIPDFRFVWLNDLTNNANTLQPLAQAFANRLLLSTALPPREMEITGFYPIELGGRVTQVSYSQESCRTRVLLDAWNLSVDDPSIADRNELAGDARQPARQKSRQSTFARRVARERHQRDGGSAASGGSGPATVPTATTPTPAGWQPVIVVVSSPVSGQRGRYLGKAHTGKLDAASSGNLVAAHIGAAASSDDVNLWNAAEIVPTAPALSPGQILVAMAGPQDASGRTIAIAMAAAGGIQAIRLNTSVGFIQVSFKASPQESDWVNAIAVNNCPSSAARGPSAIVGDDTTGLTEGGAESAMRYAKPKTPSGLIEVPYADIEGTDATLLLTAESTHGSTVLSVELSARTSVTKGLFRFWHEVASSGVLVPVHPVVVMPEIIPQSGHDTWSVVWLPNDLENGFLLGPGDKLHGAPSTEDKIFFKVNGVDFTN